MSGLGKIAARLAHRQFLRGLGKAGAGHSAAAHGQALRSMYLLTPRRRRRGLRGLGDDSVDIPTGGGFDAPIGPGLPAANPLPFDPTLLPDSSIPNFTPATIPNSLPGIPNLVKLDPYNYPPSSQIAAMTPSQILQLASTVAVAALSRGTKGYTPQQVAALNQAAYKQGAASTSAGSSIVDWLTQQSIVSGVPNYAFAGVGGLILVAVMAKRR